VALFWMGPKPAPIWEPKNRLWNISASIWTTVKYTILCYRKEYWTRSGLSGETTHHIHQILHPRTLVFWMEPEDMKGNSFSSREVAKTFLLEIWEKNGSRSTFQRV
jgi:hypothetical protein